jgi:hypothetical protein
LSTALPCLLALAGPVYAQTAEIQREVEQKLWLLRVLARIEAATGAPAAVVIGTLLALVLALVTAVWLWYARRKRAGK